MSDQATHGVSSQAVVAIAVAAAEKILSIKSSAEVSVTKKADDSPVTKADVEASDLILKRLSDLTPDIPAISEEHVLQPVRGFSKFWLIDPLDGTKEFISGSPEYTVNIALIENHVPVFGVVVVPETMETFVGGNLCRPKLLHRGKETPLLTRKFMSGNARCFLSRSHRSNEIDLCRDTFPEVSVTHMGSSLKYLRIAEGVGDFSFRKTPTSIWDTGAAHAVLKAAGGDILSPSGLPLSYNVSVLLNPPFLAVGDLRANWSPLLNNLRDHK